MSDSPMRALVAAKLRPMHEQAAILDDEFRLDVFDAAAPVGAEAVAGSGVGIDPFRGERVLASLLYVDRPKGYEHRLACAITDRRTALSGWSDIRGGFNGKRFSVLHHDVGRIESKESMLKNFVALLTPTGRHEMTFAHATKLLVDFYQTMVSQVPPAHRVEPPTPFVEPTDDDPSGARGAAAHLYEPDPGTERVLATLDEQVRTGALPADRGADLVSRAVLSHRAERSAPGMVDDTWVSAMTAQDLGHTLTNVYGAPAGHTQPQPGMHWLDFRLDPRRDPVGSAMTALGVASHIAFGVGFSPGKAIAGALLQKTPITQLRVVFAEDRGFTRYQLQAADGPLGARDAMMAHRIHQMLAHVGGEVLERRAAAGWDRPYAELF